jgi:hypothetical protein
MTRIRYQSQRVNREPKNRFDYDKRQVKDHAHHKAPAKVSGRITMSMRMGMVVGHGSK